MLGGIAHPTDGTVRRGSGEIRITDVEMLVGDGDHPVKRCRTSDRVRLRLHYESEKTIPQPVFGIEITALGGTTVSAPNTRDVGLVPATVSGTGTVEVVLPRVDLLPGTYDLHTSVTDFNLAHVYDHLQVALRFDVTTGKPYEMGGVVTMRPEWELS